MKRLYILRHSKAGQTDKKVLDDHERKLTGKGVELCAFIADYLASFNPQPELILSSTALRAKQTAELVLSHLGKKIDIQYISKLYLASPDDLASILHGVNNSINSVLIVGHNPGLQQFCVGLSGSGDKKLFRDMRNNFPPPSLAVFDIKCQDWPDVDIHTGELIGFSSGKVLKKK